MSVASSFDLHRHRFLAPAVLRQQLAEAIEALEHDVPNATGRALPLLAHAPYDVDLHRALARFYLRYGDVLEAKLHIEACTDLAVDLDLLETFTASPDRMAIALDAVAHARAGMYARCRTGELRFTQLEPTFEDFSLVLRWPEVHDERVQGAIDHLAVQCGRIESVVEEEARDDARWTLLAPSMESPFQCQRDLFCALTPFTSIRGPVGLVLRTLEAIAPWLEDVRFLARVDGAALHECWIVAGCFYMSRLVTPLYRDSVIGTAEYLEPIYLATDGKDDALQQYLLDLWSQTFPIRLDVWGSESSETVLHAEQTIARMQNLGKEPQFLIARLARARDDLPATVEALRPLATASLDDPRARHIHLELARALFDLTMYDEAFLWAMVAAEAAYHDDSRMLAALSAIHLGDEVRAREWLRREGEFRRDSYPGVVLREARTLVDLGNLDGARILYEALLALPRYEALAREGLALCVQR